MAERLDTIAFGPSMRIERHRLDNGLTVLVQPDHSAPVVSYQTWLGVGSRHEQTGKTGIAHLFEHLMFNETENHPQGAFDRRLEELGADNNAATYVDWTFYVDNLPKQALELVIELESDRLQHLVLRDPQVECEREVVLNERRETVDDDVDGSVSEVLHLTAFEQHPYRHPVIGFARDIEGLSVEDCRRFYETYYAPNNATVVVVGDVEPEAVVRAIEARYGAIRSALLPEERLAIEPAQLRERRKTLYKPTDSAKLVVAYKAPAMREAGHPALVLLNEILFGGRGSRGHRLLVDELELASELYAYVDHLQQPGLWEIHASIRDGVEPAAALEVLDRLLGEARSEGVSDDEIARACAPLELATLQGVVEISGRAEQIGFSEVVLGKPAALFDRLDAYRRCGHEELAEVASASLAPERRTVIEVLPVEDP